METALAEPTNCLGGTELPAVHHAQDPVHTPLVPISISTFRFIFNR